jgi:hypothetical protein
VDKNILLLHFFDQIMVMVFRMLDYSKLFSSLNGNHFKREQIQHNPHVMFLTLRSYLIQHSASMIFIVYIYSYCNISSIQGSPQSGIQILSSEEKF